MKLIESYSNEINKQLLSSSSLSTSSVSSTSSTSSPGCHNNDASMASSAYSTSSTTTNSKSQNNKSTTTPPPTKSDSKTINGTSNSTLCNVSSSTSSGISSHIVSSASSTTSESPSTVDNSSSSNVQKSNHKTIEIAIQKETTKHKENKKINNKNEIQLPTNDKRKLAPKAYISEDGDIDMEELNVQNNFTLKNGNDSAIIKKRPPNTSELYFFRPKTTTELNQQRHSMRILPESKQSYQHSNDNYYAVDERRGSVERSRPELVAAFPRSSKTQSFSYTPHFSPHQQQSPTCNIILSNNRNHQNQLAAAAAAAAAVIIKINIFLFFFFCLI
jgi:hypothetical protein